MATDEYEKIPLQLGELPRDRLARIMFWLGFLYLLVIAGLIHRYNRIDVTESEKSILINGLWLWFVFVIEGLWRIVHPHRFRSRGKEISRLFLVMFFPPFRMGMQSVSRYRQVWLPFAAWQNVDKNLVKKLDRKFAVPMLIFAFLILPILILEYTWVEQINDNPELAFALHLGISIIWVAFALEFILKVSVAPKTMVYLKDRWIDAAIVFLPFLEFIITTWVDAAPLARLLRLSRAIQPEQISRMSRLYRMRGLLMRAWHAFLLLEVVGKLMGYPPEKRLRHLEEQLTIKEEEIAEIKTQITAVKKLIEERDTRKPDDS